jgi:hypothetical protein
VIPARKEGLLFLKKEAKNFWLSSEKDPEAHANGEKFFGSFFQKRTLLLPRPCAASV